MRLEIDPEKVKRDAEELYRSGQFYCSEAIVSAIRDNFRLEMPEEMVAMASGFPVGIGKSKCVCGAVSGGVMCLGYVFGRSRGSTPKDPRSVKTLQLAGELHDWFREKNLVLCCRVLTRGMDMASGEHKDQCVRFTGEIAETTARMIVREKPEDYELKEAFLP